MQDQHKNAPEGELIVLKFGSSVLRTRRDLPNAVHEIYRWYRTGNRVIAVVSAIGATTDDLLCYAREVAGSEREADSCPYALAELLATGERLSAALLGIALDRAGVPARVLNPREIGLTATGSPLDGELSAVNIDRVRKLLKDFSVLVVPGFFGTDAEGRTHLLGRGGSDFTAAFLAQSLSANRCRLIKDVDGVYETDPRNAREAGPPRRFATLDYAKSLEVATPLIQPKAVAFLRQYAACAEVAACARPYETKVHAGPNQLHGVSSSHPSKVLILGLGNVGFGVYQRLRANPADFEVIGALVRDGGKHERLGLPRGLLRTRADQVLKLRADLVVDALPGIEPSQTLIEHFLSIGVPVVSANKAVIAESGSLLATLTKRVGTRFRYSAAVGGAAPLIEAVEQSVAAGPIASLSAVLSGACNVLLNRCAEGVVLEDAVAEAQRAGFAEVDAREDLSGEDSVRKLRILCRHAFGAEPKEIASTALDEAIAQRARGMRRTRRVLRQIARASRFNSAVRASVCFEEVPAQSLFGCLADEWNALQILMNDGSLRSVRGRGAGQWPTTEAVMVDIFDVLRQRQGALGSPLCPPICS